MDFAIGLVDSVLTLPNGRSSNYRRNAINLAWKKSLGVSQKDFWASTMYILATACP